MYRQGWLKKRRMSSVDQHLGKQKWFLLIWKHQTTYNSVLSMLWSALIAAGQLYFPASAIMPSLKWSAKYLQIPSKTQVKTVGALWLADGRNFVHKIFWTFSSLSEGINPSHSVDFPGPFPKSHNQQWKGQLCWEHWQNFRKCRNNKH